MLSKTMLLHYAECHYAECRSLFIIMLNVIMLNGIMLNVVMLSVVFNIIYNYTEMMMSVIILNVFML